MKSLRFDTYVYAINKWVRVTYILHLIVKLVVSGAGATARRGKGG